MLDRVEGTQKPVSMAAVLREGALAALAAALLPAVAFTLAYQALSILHPFPLDYSEAPLVDQALRLAAGHNIYRPDLSAPPYTISNYPPLYVAALVPGVALFGPAFVAGRLLSTLCAWLVAACLALMVHTHSRDRVAALAAGLLFLTLPYVTYWSSLLRVDLLALALSIAALTVLARWPAGRWSLVAAGLLLTAAVYTRQSYALAAPLAAFAWLWVGVRSPRRALGLAALVAGLGLAVYVALQAATRGGFYFNIVTANVNEYKWDNLTGNLEGLWRNGWPLLLLALAAVVAGPRRLPLYALAVPYLLGGALSALTIGKIGSNVNYLLELCAGLCLAAAGLLAWARQAHRSPAVWAGLVVAVLLAVQVGHSLRHTLAGYGTELGNRRALTNDLHRLAALVAGAEGPVLADEYMGLSTLSGRPLYLQPFEVTQLAWAGVWDQSPLLASLAEQQFALILIYDRPWYTERWTAEMLAAIEGDYRLIARLADNKVYQPYTPPAATVGSACPGAPWRLPTEAARGLEARAGELIFFGGGADGAVPVVAVADGRLTRPRDWFHAVAIEHPDPLRPGETVWTYYGELASANGRNSHIAPEFPPGTDAVPVSAGQVLGYQGNWSGRDHWPTWVHVRFAVARGPTPGEFPETLTPAVLLDPAAYLGLAAGPQTADLAPLRCGGQ